MGIWDAVGAGIGALVGIGGNILGENAAEKAQKKQIKFLEQSRDLALAELHKGKAEASTALRGGQEQANAIYDPLVQSGQSGRNYWLQTLGLPEGVLTDAQNIGAEDLRRQGIRNLSVGGLRGSGAGQAVLADTMARYRANADAVNRARRDDAAARLGGEGFAASTAKAATATGTASNLANAALGVGGQSSGVQMTTGQNVGNVLNSIGQEQGNSITSSANQLGETIAALGGMFNGREKARPSRYDGTTYVV